MKEVLQIMLLTKRKPVTVFLAMVGVMSVLATSFFAPMRAAPTAKTTLATKITFRGDDIGDVASLLKIQKLVCEVELRPEVLFDRLSLDIEIYKDGQKQKTAPSGPAFEAAYKWEKIIPVKVAFLVADLDYLPLRGAVKNHYRMQVKMALKGAQRVNTDVPKELFDFSRVNASGPFLPEAGSATEAPLFFIKARSRGVTDADTVSEFLEKNAKGDVLIAYLRVRKE